MADWRRSSGGSGIPAATAAESDRAATRAAARAATWLGEVAAGDGRVDQAPVHRLAALHPLGPGGDHVGQVPPDMALVDQPGQASGAGEDAEERHLGQRDGRGAVVDEDDLLAGQGQLVAAAGGRAVDGAQPHLVRAERRRPRWPGGSRW